MGDSLFFLIKAPIIGFLFCVILSVALNTWINSLLSNGTFDGVLSSANFEEWRSINEVRRIYYKRNLELLPRITVGFCLMVAELNKLVEMDQELDRHMMSEVLIFKRIPGGKRPPNISVGKLFRNLRPA